MIEYRRNLPHILPEQGVFFITFRIYNSLPLKIIADLKNNYEKEIKAARNFVSNSRRFRSRLLEIYDDYLYEFDDMLDKYTTEFDLTNPELATIIINSIRYFDQKDYRLICFCIMPNHVHMIVYNLKKPLYTIMKLLKGYSSGEINKILERKGKFWQSESYDNYIRSRNDLHNKIQYVMNNPVKAGLVSNRKDWKYSYCDPRFLED